MNATRLKHPWLGARIAGALALGLLGAACTANADPSTDTTSSALTVADGEDAASAADRRAAVAACFTEFVTCVRGGAAVDTCGRSLHACMPKPPRHKHGGGDGDCKRGDGDRPPPPDGDRPPPPDGDRPPPPDGDRPPPPDGDRPPPPPPPGADGGAPPPPPPGGGAHRACHESLVTCAKGTDAVATCVDDALACFDAAGPPPRPHHPPPPPPPAAPPSSG